MRRLASILCLGAALALTSCESFLFEGLMRSYEHAGRNPKPKKYVPVIRDFGGFNGREIWLYSPSQLATPSHAASAPSKAAFFEQPLLVPYKYHGVEDYQNVEDWGVTVNGCDYTVPMGLIVDGASVPRACWFFMPPDGLHRGAALFHDWSYINRGVFARGPPLTRLQTDQAFYNLMLEAGVSPTRAGIAYRGVRLGGWAAWASIETPTILPVERHGMAAPLFLKPRSFLSHLYAQ